MASPLSKDLRERIVKLRSEGKTQEQIAEQLLIRQSSVSRILKRYRLLGNLKRTKPPGHRRILKAEDEQLLVSFVEKAPDATLQELAVLLLEETGKTISTTTVHTALKRLKITRKKRRSMTPLKTLKKHRNEDESL